MCPPELHSLAFIAKSLAGDAADGSLTYLISGDASLDGYEAAMQTYDGLVGERMVDEGDMEMESETTRSVLRTASRRFISYSALSRNRVACSRRGHSYYNCRPRRRVNPYRRRCSIITWCARIIH